MGPMVPMAFKMMMIHPICRAQETNASVQGAHAGIAWSQARSPMRPLLSRITARCTSGAIVAVEWGPLIFRPPKIMPVFYQ